MAERIVSYKIKVIQDGANANQLNEFAKAVLASERKIAIEREQINGRATLAINKQNDSLAQDLRKINADTAASMAASVEDLTKRSAAAAIDAAKRVEGSLSGTTTRMTATLEKSTSEMNEAVGRSSAAAISQAEGAASNAANRIGQNWDKASASVEDFEGKMQDAGREIRGRFEEWATGVMQFGRGIASIGLIGSESTEKLVRGLVAAQGAFDTVIGGVKVYQELRRVVEAYNAAQVLASQVQTATTARNIAAIEAEAVATNTLAAARGRAAAAGAASQASGAASSIPKVGRLGRIGAAVSGTGAKVGGAIMAGGGALAGKVGAAGIGAGAAGLAAAGLAAIASSAFAVVSAFETTKEAFNNGLGGGAAEGSLTDTIGGSNYNPFSWLIAFDVKMEAMAGKSATERMQLELEANRILNQRNRDLAQVQSQALTQQLDNRLGDMQLIGDGTAEERLQNNQQRLQALQSSSGSIIEQADAAGGTAGLEARRELLQRETQLQQEQLSIQQEISREKLNAAKESLNAAKEELQITQQSLQADRDRLLSAKERFGQLSEIEQQRLIGIKNRADSGQDLTREERALLRSVGTEDATGIAQQGDLAAADAAGFDQVFGQSERDRIARNEQVEQRLQAEVQVQQDLVVKVEQDNEAVIRSVKEQIQGLKDELYPVVEQIIQEEVLAARQQIRQEFEARQSQLPRGGGRR